MRQFIKYLALLSVGGGVFMLYELISRGHSHWTMFLLGGLCFIFMGLINEVLPQETPVLLQMLLGSVAVTLMEFITGYIVNIRLGWQVWDYSGIPLNFMGQICLLYSVLWFFFSGVGIVLDDWIRWRWFGEDKPQYRL